MTSWARRAGEVVIPWLCPDDLCASLLLGAQIPGGVLPRGYLDLSLWRADTPMKSMLVGPGLASEHSYQKKLQEVGQSGTEPTSEHACAPTHTCTYTRTLSCHPSGTVQRHTIPFPPKHSFSCPHPHTRSPAHSQYARPPTRDHGAKRSWLGSHSGPVFNTRTSRHVSFKQGTSPLPAFLCSSVKWA